MLSTLHIHSQEDIVQKFHAKCWLVHYIVAAALLFCALPSGALARPDDIKAGNISFKVAGQVVVIYYDLNAPADQLYKVTLTLKKRFDATFTYTPVDISGDVGQSVVPGENRIITWKLADEFPKGLPGEDCFFVVGVEPGVPAGFQITPLMWIAGGAAVVGGVLLAVLLKGNTVPPPPPPTPGFPSPPGRP